jgi:hypothetical protein
VRLSASIGHRLDRLIHDQLASPMRSTAGIGIGIGIGISIRQRPRAADDFADLGDSWLIHRFAYRRANHKNRHVRGLIKSGENR